MNLAQAKARDTAEPALPGRWYRPLEGEAPQARRGWSRDTAEPALPGRRYRPLEGEAPQARRGWASHTPTERTDSEVSVK